MSGLFHFGTEMGPVRTFSRNQVTLTYWGMEWAENKMTTSLRFSSGKVANSFLTFSAKVRISFGCVDHRSMTLQLSFEGDLES